MTLNDLLDTYWRHAAERAPVAAAAFAAEARSLAESGRLAGALRAGDPAPDVALPDSPGASVRLRELLRDGPVVIAFYRGRWCSFCTLELRAWQRALPRIRALGARVIAVSPQVEHEVALMRERDGLQFQMVSDPGNDVARAFGVAYEVPPGLRDAYAQTGLDPARDAEPAGWTLPVPAVYLIGRDGRIAWSHVDPNWRRRAEPQEVVAQLERIAGD
jgi:peroxiredoxin